MWTMEKLGSVTIRLAEVIMQSRQFKSGMRSSVVLELIVSKKYFPGRFVLSMTPKGFQLNKNTTST